MIKGRYQETGPWWRDAGYSFLCSFIVFWTWWLMMVPLLLLMPVALYFAFRFYKKAVARMGATPVFARACGLVPAMIALGTLPAIMWAYGSSGPR